MAVHIEDVDTRTAPEELLREMHEYYIPLSDEMLPGDPPTTLERRVADWRQIRSDHSIPRWLLRVDGEIVGSAVASIDLEQSLDDGFGWIYVRPEDRGSGHARRLAKALFDRLDENGRGRFATYVKEGHPAAQLCERAGLTSAYREKRSRLVVADVDRALMRRWIDRAAERAAAYELLELQVPFPDDVVEGYCELQFQMNTAPLEGLELEDEVLEPRIWREQEQRSAASFHDLITYIVVHRPTGAFVGSTTIQTDQLQPDEAWQWETIVHPAHRNKGLGRLLKAAMIERILRDWPKVERIDTYNAGSNQPMLDINVAMGYKPIQITNTYQGPLSAARDYLRV
ncbi:MAG TPA: GNAT family N-acetyltransferase [Acidimicrobiia bacterium]